MPKLVLPYLHIVETHERPLAECPPDPPRSRTWWVIAVLVVAAVGIIWWGVGR